MFSFIATKLERELDQYLENAKTVNLEQNQRIKAVIGPHAGYRYCGPTGAYAYKSIDTTAITRVFILGPSHHIYMDGCAVSGAAECETPLGTLRVDTKVVEQLLKTSLFEQISIDQEEEEHSLEMHMPWIAKCFDINKIKVVPIMVGHVSNIYIYLASI
jgi:AmmeMemoRadiSam system protein B